MIHFNYLDMALAVIIVITVLFGLVRGFIREVISLVTFVAAFFVAAYFSPRLAVIFSHSLSAINPDSGQTAEPVSLLAVGISFLCIFILVLIVGSLVNFILSGITEGVGLGFINRLLGGVFGFLKGLLITFIVLLGLQLSSFSHEAVWEESQLVPLYQPSIIWVHKKIEPQLEVIKAQFSSDQ